MSASEDPTLDTDKPRTAGLGGAFVAGVGFGLLFIILDRAPGDSGLWPSLAVRLSAAVVYLVAALVLRVPLRLPTRDLPRLALIGVADVTALILNLLATREGLLSIVAVLTSLYPAVTVLLVRIVLEERFAAIQRVGLALAAAGIALLALG